jgi:hypothetical protein
LSLSRRIKRRHRIVVGGHTAFEDDDDGQGRPSEWFDHQTGGHWLSAVDRSAALKSAAWLLDFVGAYQPWSYHAWGAGLKADAELDNLPTEWLHPFERLRLRAAVDLPWEQFEPAVLVPLLALPDQSFLFALEAFIPSADSLFWDEKLLPIGHLVQLRERVCGRLKQCSLWVWRKDELTDTVAANLASAARALFFHTPVRFTGAQCYLPASASTLAPVLPALANLSIEAPGRSFIADLFLAMCERAKAWAPIDLVLSVAEAWQSARGAEAAFWRDHGFGQRLCAWFRDRMAEIDPTDRPFVDRLRHLTDQLVTAGVAEALVLEARLADL